MYGQRLTVSAFRATATSSATSAACAVVTGQRKPPGWQRAVAELGVGGAKTRWRRPRADRLPPLAMLPNHANQITIDETKKDKWGCPWWRSTAPPAKTNV